MNKLWFIKNIFFVYKKLWYDIYMIEEVIKKDIDFVDDSYKDLLKKVTSKDEYSLIILPFSRICVHTCYIYQIIKSIFNFICIFNIWEICFDFYILL